VMESGPGGGKRMEASVIQDEHELYPVHEEDTVPQNPRHFKQQMYLAGTLQAYLPRWWVTGETCLYWERGNTKRYVAPDVAVIETLPPGEPHNVYLRWSDPPLLFVAEIGSRSSLVGDTGPKVSTYEQKLCVPEYLYADPPRSDLRLWRMADGRYHPVSRTAEGRVWSEQLSVFFGYDENGLLRAYTPAGEMLQTHEEAQADARAAHRRVAELTAELERLRAGRS
ncbi:MAG: Uma2 family endonuclease, partial [Chloroflexi bacterium]|nr:Uma2 family endonuclease [Chloroflexota bacterium]